MLALAYQFFLLLEESNHIKAIEHILHAYTSSKQTEEIIRFLRKISQKQPDNQISANTQRTAIQLLEYIEADQADQQQKLIAAASDFLRRLIHQPSFSSELLAGIYRKRSIAFLSLDEYKRAIKDLDRMIDLDPKDAQACSLRGEAYRLQGQYEHAIADFDRAIELDPKYSWTYDSRGEAYRQQRQYEQAIADFDRAIELDPKDSWAYSLRGFTYMDLKNFGQAKTDLTHCQELDPKDVNRIWNLEWFEMCLGRPNPDIAERLDEIAATNPQHYVAYVCQGVALYMRERFEEALTKLEQAILLEPEEIDAPFWEGMVCANLGQNSKATEAIKKALALNMPLGLLAPLHWLEQDRPDFYKRYAMPLLAEYEK